MTLGAAATGRAVIGQAIAPCWLVASGLDSRQGPLNGFALTGGRFRQVADYRFQGGEALRVEQRGQGGRPGGLVLVETLVNGRVPEFPGLNSPSRPLPLTGGREAEEEASRRARRVRGALHRLLGTHRGRAYGGLRTIRPPRRPQICCPLHVGPAPSLPLLFLPQGQARFPLAGNRT